MKVLCIKNGFVMNALVVSDLSAFQSSCSAFCAQFDSVIADDGTPRPWATDSTSLSLDELKQFRFTQIDKQTDELFKLGYTFRGVQFSLSGEAQRFLTAMYCVRENPAFVYPVRYNSLDDTGYVDLAAASDIEEMYLTAIGTGRVYLGSGTALKDSIRAATTIEDVTAVVDTR